MEPLSASGVFPVSPNHPRNVMLAPAYLDMPPLVAATNPSSPIYATALPPPPGAYMGSFSAATYQKSRRSWLNRVPKTRVQPQMHPAAMLHRDYLQEYREKYGTLSPDHHLLLDPWHHPVHHIHPAVIASASTTSPAQTHGICACPGTKKLGKPCKTCGHRVAGVNKAGTVKGGTFRGSGTKVRAALPQVTPTISPMRLRPTPTSPQDENVTSPQADPYDIMRRSRLSLQEKGGSVRTRSKSSSPSRARHSFPQSYDTTKLDDWVTSTPPLSSSDSECETSNKSILECDVTAYELISKYLKPDSDDNLSDNAIDDPKWSIPRIKTDLKHGNSMPSLNGTPKPPPRKRRIKKSIKSILKKTSLDETVYIPSYQEFRQRKKQVQFNEGDTRRLGFSAQESERSVSVCEAAEPARAEEQDHGPQGDQAGKPRQKVVKRREGGSIVHIRGDHHKLFIDTMRLRMAPHPRGDSRDAFDSKLLRPRDPPPPPPSPTKSDIASPEIERKVSFSCNETVTSLPEPETVTSLPETVTSPTRTKRKVSILSPESVTTPPEPVTSPTEPVTSPTEPVTSLYEPVASLPETSDPELVALPPRNNRKVSVPSPETAEAVEQSNCSPVTVEEAPVTKDDVVLVSPIKSNNSPNVLEEPVIVSSSISITPGPIVPSEVVPQNSVLSGPVTSSPITPGPTTGPILTHTPISSGPITNSTSTDNPILPAGPVKSSPILTHSPVTSVNDVNATIVRVNDDLDTSSNDSEYNTLRINIGRDSSTILSVNSCPDYEPIVPHICSKGQVVTIGDTSIIEKVENKRRSKSAPNSCYVSTSIKVLGPSNRTVWISPRNNSDTDYEGSTNKSKFYDLEDDLEYDDAEIEGHYEMIRDPIYEEISEPQAKSIFEGASKYDILNYLVGARERGIPLENTREGNSLELGSDLGSTSAPCSELVSHVSDSSEDAAPLRSTPAKSRRSSAEIERNDSGVGSETSQSSRSRWLLQRRSLTDQGDLLCEDCEQNVEPQVTDSGLVYAPLVCRKCGKRRSERREIITELLETEIKYGRDLKIMTEEFYRPMLVAGLLSQEQLDAIFLNVPELLEVSCQLSERLQDAVDIALDQGDEDLLTVNVGRLLLDCSHMLHAFEMYCTRQGAASILLSSLEKDKELLKIFLRVSQMENAVLRRMNLNSFLMVPVQRVTKYPLLLSRLYKATPPHYEAREMLKQAQQKIEAHLEHMNAEAKDLTATKLWRRISIINVPYRRISSEPDLNIRLRKLALEVLGWGHEDSRFVMEGRLLFTQPTDSNWRKGRTIKLSHLNALLVTHGKRNNEPKTINNDKLTFPRDTGIQEAALLLLKDKTGRCSTFREPLLLDKCIICAEFQDIEECFEVQEIPTKESFIFKAESVDQTREWFRRLQFHAQGLGGWRRRRNALANIMMNGMVPRN